MRRRAFSMIELMVVIAVIALISTITLGSFRSVANGNRKTSCQSNMAQIYGALRLYGQDYNGKFPLLNGTANTIRVGTDGLGNAINMAPGEGIGLWSLYAYGENPGASAPPLVTFPLPSEAQSTGYLKSAKVFHCPNDDFTYTNSGLGISGLSTAQINYVQAGRTYNNPSYLSYQSPPLSTGVNNLKVDDLTGTAVYSTFRRDDGGSTTDTSNKDRQLVYFSGTTPNFRRRSADNTVVMWCRFHRKLDKNGFAVSANDTNDHDNVLFMDGSVQWVQSKEPVGEGGNATKTCDRGWDRVPNQEQYTLSAAAATFCTGPTP